MKYQAAQVMDDGFLLHFDPSSGCQPTILWNDNVLKVFLQKILG